MNATNRVINRAVLLVIGVLLAAAGAAAVLLTWRPPWARPILDLADRTAAGIRSLWESTTTLPAIGAAVPVAALVSLGIALAVIVLLVIFLCTRGGGRRRTVLDVRGKHGSTVVDRDVVRDVLAQTIADRPDVVSTRADVYTVKKEPAVDLIVRMGRGADPARVLAAVDAAIADWDALAGRRVPLLVHLADRTWRDRLR